MPRVLISQGGRRSDYPCGESIAGPTWLAICFNADWTDWWHTAVDLRRTLISELPGTTQTQRDQVNAWLRSWLDDDAPLASQVLALSDPSFVGPGIEWGPDPGVVWSKGRLTALVEYAVMGAELVEDVTGAAVFTEDAGDDRPERSLKPLAYGLAAGAALVVGLVLYLK